MRDKTFFPREEKPELLFEKILADPWACNKLFETFCDSLFCNDDSSATLLPHEFTQALFNSYSNRDLSAFLMAITQNTLFDLLRNSGALLPEFQNYAHDKHYQHFYNIYKDLKNKENIFLARAYRYSHTYTEDSSDVEQQVLEQNTGILLIRKLPDTVKLKETEAEAYCAVWDLMLRLEKSLPSAYIFYGQDSLVEHNEHFDELGIFLPNSTFLKNLEHHVEKAEDIIYDRN